MLTSGQAMYDSLIFVVAGIFAGLLGRPIMTQMQHKIVQRKAGVSVIICVTTFIFLVARIIQSYLNYHETFKEGWYVLVWVLIFTGCTVTMFHIEKDE